MQDEQVDMGSNHHLIAAEVTIKLFACKRPYSVRHRFDVSNQKDPQYVNECHLVVVKCIYTQLCKTTKHTRTMTTTIPRQIKNNLPMEQQMESER